MTFEKGVSVEFWKQMPNCTGLVSMSVVTMWRLQVWTPLQKFERKVNMMEL